MTRWGSTFAMVDRLLIFKDYCEQVAAAGTKELKLTQIEWNEALKIRNILEKPNTTTIVLQSANITPGLFMKEWKKLCKFLQDNGEEISLGIIASMQKREEKLFKNTHFLAGVYVDPRYRILLSPSQTLHAKEGLLDIARRVENKGFH